MNLCIRTIGAVIGAVSPRWALRRARARRALADVGKPSPKPMPHCHTDDDDTGWTLIDGPELDRRFARLNRRAWAWRM